MAHEGSPSQNVYATNAGAVNNHGTQNNYFVGDEFRIASNVPDPPAHLIPRADKLKELRAAHAGGEAHLALSTVVADGEGGQGKSILALLYAIVYKDQFPLGRVFLPCSGRSPAEIFAEHAPPHLVKESTEERARFVLSTLGQKAGYLVILDNIDGPTHWDEFMKCGIHPKDPCKVIVTTREGLPEMKTVHVDRLTLDEGFDLLAQYRPSARLPEHREAILQILDETEGLAVLVAAVGASMELDLRDDWARYSDWMHDAATGTLPKTATRYAQTTQAILDNFYSRLSLGERSVLEHAALLPVDRIRVDWLIDLVEMETRRTPPLDLGTDSTGEPRSPQYSVNSLIRRGGLRKATTDDDDQRLSLHRLHRKRTLEILRRDETFSQRKENVYGLAAEKFQQSLMLLEQSHNSASMLFSNDTISIGESLRALVEPQEEWSPSLRNDLASAYSNRGNARGGLGDGRGAVEDYDTAISIGESLRTLLEPRGEWSPNLCNDLAGTYGNRGIALGGLGNGRGAVEDFNEAISIGESLRTLLEPRGEWSPSLCNDLASAYSNRGIARRGLGDGRGAVEDFNEAISLRESLRALLETRGEWSPSLRNALATAYSNRGNARGDLGDGRGAVEDFNEAISLRESLRALLETRGEWSPSLRNALATAYSNRGIARGDLGDGHGAVEDYDAAISLGESLRALLETRGEWSPSLRNALSTAYSNRGIARGDLGDGRGAVEDFDAAISIGESLRTLLEPRGEWSPALCNDLASVYGNRGNALGNLGDGGGAVGDYDTAISLRESLRVQLESRGWWSQSFRTGLAKVYSNRGIAQRMLGKEQEAKNSFASADRIRAIGDDSD